MTTADRPNRRRPPSGESPRTFRPVALLAASLMVLAACGSDGSDSTDSLDYYDGENVHILLAVAPGGAVDRTGRFIAEWLPNYLDGDVTASVENMPGAGHQTASGHFEHQVDRDGLTLMSGAGTPHGAWLFSGGNLAWDYRDWHPLVASPSGNIWYASRDNAGIESLQDLIDGNHEQLYFSGQTPTGADLARVFILHVLEIDHETVWGFDGRGPARIAYEQGEANIGVDATVDLEAIRMIDEGFSVPLFTTGSTPQDPADLLDPDPVFPELPTWVDVYEMKFGELPSGEWLEAAMILDNLQAGLGRMFYMHSDDPPEAIAAMEQAFADMAADPAFQEAAAEVLGPYPVLVGDQLNTAWRATLVDYEPATIDFIVDFVLDTYGVDVREAEG